MDGIIGFILKIIQLEYLRSAHADILGSSPTVQQGIDVVKDNIEWMELHQEEIGKWLKENPPAEPTATTTTPEKTTVTTSKTTEIVSLLYT